MEIQGLKTGATGIDNLLLRMANSFFSGLMWVKESQEVDGHWTDFGYTCMVVAQLNVIGSDLLSDNLEKAIQYIKSGQRTPGKFATKNQGGEPTLGSTCGAIWGLYSSRQSLSPSELKHSLNFIEEWTSKKKWGATYSAYTTLAALEAIESREGRLAEQGEKIKRNAVEWIKSDNNWRLGAWVGEETLKPRDITRNTAVALLALEKVNERPDSLLVSSAIASLKENWNDRETRNHNRSMAWILKALVYWDHNLESDLLRNVINRLVDNQNDDGSWGDTKGEPGNDIHTTRVLESFSLLFRRYHISLSAFEAIEPQLKLEYLMRTIEEQVASKFKDREKNEKNLESRNLELGSENRKLKLLLASVAIVLAVIGVVFTVISLF